MGQPNIRCPVQNSTIYRRVREIVFYQLHGQTNKWAGFAGPECAAHVWKFFFSKQRHKKLVPPRIAKKVLFGSERMKKLAKRTLLYQQVQICTIMFFAGQSCWLRITQQNISGIVVKSDVFVTRMKQSSTSSYCAHSCACYRRRSMSCLIFQRLLVSLICQGISCVGWMRNLRLKSK